MLINPNDNSNIGYIVDRDFRIDGLAYLGSKSDPYYVLAQLHTKSLTPTHYICLMDSMMGLSIEIIKKKDVLTLDLNGEINDLELIRIESDEEFQSVYNFLDNLGLFDKFKSKPSEEIYKKGLSN